MQLRAPGPSSRQDRRPLLRRNQRRWPPPWLHLLPGSGSEHTVTTSMTNRLVWAPDGSTPSGAWWPRSHDATTELRALLPQVIDHLGGPVSRVSLNIEGWDADQPRRLRLGDRLVRLGWFHTIDPTTITFSRSGDARVSLRLVPPELDPDEANELLRQASRSSA